MTVNDLVSQLQKMIAEEKITGEESLAIQAFGGMRSGKPVKTISIGFDWDHGKVIIHPEWPLTLYTKEKKK